MQPERRLQLIFRFLTTTASEAVEDVPRQESQRQVLISNYGTKGVLPVFLRLTCKPREALLLSNSSG